MKKQNIRKRKTLLIIIVLFIIIAQIILQINNFEKDERIQTSIQLPLYLKFSDNSWVVYEIKPEVYFMEDEIMIEINSLGLRDSEFSDKKDKYIIIGIGDSITFGSGVLIEKTFLKVLENKLNNNTLEEYEVWNVGIPGYNTIQQVEIFKDKILRYNPDMVIVGFFQNDFNPPYSNFIINEDYYLKNNLFGKILNKPVIKKIKITQYLDNSIYNFLKKTRMSEIYKNYGENISDNANKINEESFFELIKLSQDNNFKLIIVELPYLEEVGMPETIEHLFIEKQKEESDINIIQMLPIFKEKTESIESLRVIPIDNVHPGELGHQIIGETIFEYIISNNLLN